MLAKRIVPCLDINKGRVVKGVHFVQLKDAGDPVKNAQFYEQEGADELVFLDITASFERRSTTIDLVRKVAEVVFMPFTVGGGIRSVEDIRALLLAGADKVSLNTVAVNSPAIVRKSSSIFGSQCIVVAIDAKRMHSAKRRGKSGRQWEVYINGGRTPTGLNALTWAKRVESLGAGEILLTSMDYDGTKDGYDIELTKEITAQVKIPVIASGGAGQIGHFYDVFHCTGASAALAASIFHYREIRIKEIKEQLHTKGIEVRI